MAIRRRSVLLGGATLCLAAPGIVRGQTTSKTNVSHGFAMHGTPKYAVDAGPPPGAGQEVEHAEVDDQAQTRQEQRRGEESRAGLVPAQQKPALPQPPYVKQF